MIIESDVSVNPHYMVYNEVRQMGLMDHPKRKEEVVQILLKELDNLGYEETAHLLQEESGIRGEESRLCCIKREVLEGKYAEAIDNLGKMEIENKNLVMFNLYRQMFMELVQSREFEKAVDLLRNQLYRFHQESGEIHKLASLVFSDSNVIQVQSRKELYRQLINLEGSGIKQNVFDLLMQEAIKFQQLNCPLHSSIQSDQYSLLNDHRCLSQSPPIHLQHTITTLDDEVWLLKFSPHNNYLAASTRAFSIFIIQIHNNNNSLINNKYEMKQVNESHKKEVNAILFNNDETKLYSASNDCVIHVYDTNSGQLQNKLLMHKSAVLTLALHPTTHLLYTAGVDNWIGVWNADSQFIDYLETKIVKNILFTRNGTKMIVVYACQTYINILNPGNKHQLIATLEDTQKVTSSSISQDDQYLLLIISKKMPELHLWNLNSMQVQHTFTGFIQNQFQLQCIFLGNREYYVAVGGEDGKVHLYHKNNPKFHEILDAHTMAINSLDWNPALQLMATASDDSTIRLWGLTPKQQLLHQTINDDQSQSQSDSQ